MLRSLPFRPIASPVAGFLSICLLLCPTHPLRAADDDSTVIAHDGDAKVTAAEVRTTVQGMDANTQATVIRDPAALDKVVTSMIAQRLVLKEALDKKWDQDPAVTAALERLRDNAIVQTYLQAVSTPPGTYPSDTELQTVYDANKAQLIVPRQFDLAQIYIKNPKGADPAVAAKAQVKLAAVRKELARHGADFAAVATAESDDAASSAKGGELGWLPETRVQPEIRAELGSLSKGSVSSPVRLDDGWHILKVLDVKEQYTPTLDEIKPQLTQRMRTTRMQQNTQQYLAKMLQDNPPQIDELELAKVLK